MVLLAYGLLGLIIGSFLNVLIIRYGARSLGGRSSCMACGAPLAWFDMIPVVSWIYLRGKCRACHARISIQYPIVEALTGIVFAVIGAALHPFSLLLLISLGMVALLIAIAVYDFHHTIIPDAWVYSFAVLAFISNFIGSSPPDQATFFGILLAGPIAAFPLFSLWLVSRGRWMGLGDAKLALGIGWLLGPVLGISSVFFAFIIGALVSVPLVILSSEWWKNFIKGFTPTPISQRLVWGFTMGSEIPFGPFLVCSCIIIWLSLLYDIALPHIFGDLLLLNFSL